MERDYYRIRRRNFVSRTRMIFVEKGVSYFIKLLLKIIFGYFYILFKSPRRFKFRGKYYNYYYHMYHTTWINERAVEIPIIWSIVNKHKDKKILEIGNVLSHYYNVNYDILDKYEKSDNVMNDDVIDFKTSKKYDLIISISTLEHVGWDETPRKPRKALLAINRLKKFLARKGKIVITLPLGHNLELDKIILNGKINFAEKDYLKRISEDNHWIETNLDNICDVRYNTPFPAANGIVIGVIKNK